MKHLASLLIVFVVLLSISCEKVEPISGDSYLKVVNDFEYSVQIYFDTSYIGRVGSDENETWSVPSGTHTVEAKCSFSNDIEEIILFITGETIVMTLESVINNKSESILQSRKIDNSAYYN